jgi:hypothetical protein
MEHYERESGHNTVFIQIALRGEMLPTVTSLASPRIYNLVDLQTKKLMLTKKTKTITSGDTSEIRNLSNKIAMQS